MEGLPLDAISIEETLGAPEQTKSEADALHMGLWAYTACDNESRDSHAGQNETRIKLTDPISLKPDKLSYSTIGVS